MFIYIYSACMCFEKVSESWNTTALQLLSNNSETSTRKMKQEEKEIRLLMLGLDNAGAFIYLFDPHKIWPKPYIQSCWDVCLAHRQDNNLEEAATWGRSSKCDHIAVLSCFEVFQRFHDFVLGTFLPGFALNLPRFNGEPVDTISPTLGFNIKTVEWGHPVPPPQPHRKTMENPKTSTGQPKEMAHESLRYEGYKLNIWDVGGQKTIRSYWRMGLWRVDILMGVLLEWWVRLLLYCGLETNIIHEMVFFQSVRH